MVMSFSSFSRLSIWVRILAGGILTALALLISGWVALPPSLKYIIPLGLILLILFNGLLFKAEGESLAKLGLDLSKTNLLFLPLGLIIGLVAFAINFFIMEGMQGNSLHFNGSMDIPAFMSYALALLPMAATQQFIVRSYCYVKTMEATNVRLATILFGLLFIALHNVFNADIFNAIFLSLSLFVSHLLFSTAFLQSGTLYFAIGIHWGCNVANDHLLVEGLHPTSLVYALPPETAPNDGSGPGILIILLYFLLINTGYIFHVRKTRCHAKF